MTLVRKAVNLNAMIFQVSRILGPALAGFVIATVGTATSFWLNGLSFIAVILSLWTVRAHQVRTNTPLQPLRDFGSALKFVRSQPRLQDIFVLVVLVTFFGLSVFNILPAFASDVLGGNAQTLGFVLSASGAGALLGVIFVIPYIQAARRMGLLIAGAVVWMGLWLTMLSQLRSLPLAMGAMLLYSVGAPAVIATSLGLAQLLAPPDMRARVMSVFVMISFGLQPISSFYVGFVAQWLGLPTAILTNGFLLICGGLLVLILRRELGTWNAAVSTTLGRASPSLGGVVVEQIEMGH